MMTAVQLDSQSDGPAFAAYSARSDLRDYDPNALLLYVAELRLTLEDIDVFAANALTDGSDDKKCDLVAVVADGRRVVVAQGYESALLKQAAPANKASDLNTAVSWLLDGPIDSLPEALRSAATEVRVALESGDVTELEIWYVHNLPESSNVQAELDQAVRTADAILSRAFPEAQVDVRAVELGRGAIEDEYARSQAPILVSESFDFTIPGGFEITGDGWKAFSTAVSLADLRALWATHHVSLMSPNIRDYLGIVKKSGNINYGIKETAKSQPANFAIYNNGITVLTNAYEPNLETGVLRVEGLGIVNGGQTTGAIGELPPEDVDGIEGAHVMARFVTCTDQTVLESIVRFNNTQNKVEATDFRSKDPIQESLRREFEAIPEAEYRGGRRGGATDAIARRRSLLPDSSVAQSLAAFHGDPNLAYNETRTIWDVDGVYAHVFRDGMTARHVVFTYSLLAAVDEAKRAIMKIAEGSRTEAQRRHASFFSARGSNYLLVSAIAGCLETIVASPIPDRYALRFRENLSPADAVTRWRPVVDVLLSFSAQLTSATDQGLKSKERVAKASADFGAMVEATRSANPSPFEVLAGRIEIASLS
jgi:hypothetical protein